MFDFIVEQLQNQFLSGGIVLMVFGALLAVGRSIPGQVFGLLHRRFIMTVDVSDQDDAFYWLQEWLAKHPYSQKSRLLTVSTRKGAFGSSGESMKELVRSNEGERVMPPVFFSPAPGLHLLRFEGNWLLIRRVRTESQGTSASNLHWREVFTIRTFCKDRDLVRRLIHGALEVAFPEGEKRVGIYSTDGYGNWRPIAMRLPRDADSVILEGGLMRGILEEVDTFFTSADWYRARGIPYQLGYLLHGPPGNGKTSLALVLASRFGRNVYVARTSGITDESFRSLMSSVPEHSIVLIEDVDCFFKEREAVNSNLLEASITFSGFLNAIDGVTGSEGRLLILTTNKPENLDSALLRPGRVDRKIEFVNATAEQAQRLFLRFFDDQGQAEEFSDALDGLELSMADLQGILIGNRKDTTAAVEALRNRRHLSVVNG